MVNKKAKRDLFASIFLLAYNCQDSIFWNNIKYQ